MDDCRLEFVRALVLYLFAQLVELLADDTISCELFGDLFTCFCSLALDILDCASAWTDSVLNVLCSLLHRRCNDFNPRCDIRHGLSCNQKDIGEDEAECGRRSQGINKSVGGPD